MHFSFQHFVFTIVRLIDLWIPDVPEKLEALIHLEDSFAREMMKEVIEVKQYTQIVGSQWPCNYTI